MVSPSSDVKTAPPIRAAPHKRGQDRAGKPLHRNAAAIDDSRYCRRRPTAAARCRARWSRPASIDMRRATVFGPSSPSPAPSDRRWLAATKFAPVTVGRPLKSRPSRCRLAHSPSIDGPQSQVDLAEARWLDAPACDSIPRIRTGPRTAQEYGLSAARQALKIRFRAGSGSAARGGPNRAAIRSRILANILDQFRLTMRRAEAYIHPLGAPSAYGAIARL